MKSTEQDPSTTGIGQARSLVVAGIVLNSVLAAIKVVGGVLGNSYALIADGVESLLDIFSSLVVWAGLKAAEKPANERHPYGYGKAESLAALIVAMVLVVAAIGISIESFREIATPHHSPAPFTLVLLCGVVLVKYGFGRMLARQSAQLGSTSLKSEAWHQGSDALTSAAAGIGIVVALIGGPGYEAADDLAALLAAGVIAMNGVHLARQPLRDILDASPDSGIDEQIRAFARPVPGVREIEKCRVRKAGLVYFVDLHVIVDGEISVRDGHEIARSVRSALCAAPLGIRDVLVHIEPEEACERGEESERAPSPSGRSTLPG